MSPLMTVLLILFFVLWLVLALSLPLRLSVDGAASCRVIELRLRVYILGLIPLPLYFTLNLIDPPRMTLLFRPPRGAPRPIPLQASTKKGVPFPWRKHISIDRLWLLLLMGVQGDAALTVWLVGAWRVILGEALPLICEDAQAQALPVFDKNLLRIDFSCMFRLYAAQSILEYWKEKRKHRASFRIHHPNDDAASA